MFVLEAGGGVVDRNTIDGFGQAAVTIWGDNWRVTRNDVTGFDGYLADIWMDEASYENRVTCPTPGDMVLDEGTDNFVRGCTLLEPFEKELSRLAEARPMAKTYDDTIGYRR